VQAVAPYLTPPAVAERYGVDVHKIIGWIRRGELRAIDVATTTGGRPRYRISPADLAQFEAARSATPQPKITRCRRKNPQVTEFF
jgi:transposase